MGRRRRRRGAPRPATLVLVPVLGLALVTAGCSAAGPGPPVEASGAAATVHPATAADLGYEHAGTTTRTLNATVSVELEGDVSVVERQPVVASVPVARYRRSTGAGPVVVAVAASPLVQVVEHPPRSADPLSTLSTAALVAFVQSVFRAPGDLEAARSRDVSVLGSTTDATTFHGTAVRAGDRVPVAVTVARVEHDADVVTVVAVHRRDADPRRLDALLGAIRHRDAGGSVRTHTGVVVPVDGRGAPGTGGPADRQVPFAV